MPRAFPTLYLLSIVGFLTCGCPQRFLPPIQPNVSLYPTVYPVRILDQCTPVDLSPASLRQVLKHADWLDGIGKAGLSEGTAQLIIRSLRKRGYAELDARRSKAQIRWIAFRALLDGKTLVASAGYDHRPPPAHLTGVDLAAKPAQASRRDAYNYPLRVDTWQGMRTNVPMVVEHIVPMVKSRPEHWEISYRVPLRDPKS